MVKHFRAAAVSAKSRFGWTAWLSAAGCLLVGLGTGCGDYSDKVQNWTHNASSGTSAAGPVDLWAAEELAGTNPALQFCRPHTFTAPPMANGQGADQRAKPTCIDVFPGLKLTCEAFQELPDKAGTQAAFYFYIGSQTAAAGGKDAVLNAFKTKLGAQPQNLSLEGWSDVEVGSKKWQKLRYTGGQVFCVKDKNGGAETFSTLPGVFEVYVLEESNSVVILGFRAPLSLETAVGLDQMAQAVAGSVARK